MNALINRGLAQRTAPLAIGFTGAVLIGYVASSPGHPLVPFALYGCVALAITLLLPPHIFVPTTLIVVGVSTAFSSPVVSIGLVAVYVSDLGVLAIALRGLTPRARYARTYPLSGAARALFLVWIFVMAVAAIRGILIGVPAASVVRSELALFYWPLLYFGFTRTLAETDIDNRLLWRNLALVAVGFAGYMFIARALHHSFHDPGLAEVPTGPGVNVQRNFGFASAFTIYPVLAIAGVAALANSAKHHARLTALATLGAVATLLTLVRGEIFSLSLGILLVLWLSPRKSARTGRARTALQLTLAATASVLAVFAVDPKLGQAVIQRSIPLVHQASGATANADYRFKAMGAGIREARAHPFGLGVLDQPRLDENRIDFNYLAHSGFATLLIYGGWLALAAGVLTLAAVIRRSFQTPAATPWLHAAFVGSIVMLSAYSLGAAGLAGDSWVVPLGALVVALRFGLRPAPSRG